MASRDFIGTKVAVIKDYRVQVYLRDDKPGLPWAGMWDLPGGAREGCETPFETASRELEEELNMNISKTEVSWQKRYRSVIDPTKDAHFIVIHVPRQGGKRLKYGEEGQRWRMMKLSEFVEHKKAIPLMKQRVIDYLNSVSVKY